jgi:hypothetical protein
LRVYVVKDGKRTQLASAEIKADTNQWQEMDIEVEDEEIQVQFNEEDIIKIEDTTLSGAGMVGLWTKADASTAFDDFGIEIEIDDDLDWSYPAQDFPVGYIDLSSAKIVIMNPDSRILPNAADMLRDEIEKRTRIGLEIATSLPPESAETIVMVYQPCNPDLLLRWRALRSGWGFGDFYGAGEILPEAEVEVPC